MIILQISGGLGNQMFQYALGKALAYSKKTSFKLFINDYSKYHNRQFDLDHLNINYELATIKEVKKYHNLQLCRFPLNCLNKPANTLLFLLTKRQVVKENGFYYNPRIFDLEGDLFLKGCWQSPKYFTQIEPKLRQDFTFKAPPVNKNKQIIKQIKKENAVSVHIRRGDYLHHKFNKILGLCSIQYYYASIKYIADKIIDPVFYFFSHDPIWVKQNFQLPYKMVIIDHNQDKNYEDLRLMTCCKHHIISNSTFGWWGAWLNSNKDKMVFAPKHWFNSASYTPKDLIPSDWIRI